jgi:hypothetical protein
MRILRSVFLPASAKRLVRNCAHAAPAWLFRNFSRTFRASVLAPFIKASNASRSVSLLALTKWLM